MANLELESDAFTSIIALVVLSIGALVLPAAGLVGFHGASAAVAGLADSPGPSANGVTWTQSASSSPSVELYNLTVHIAPAKCSVYVSGAYYSNGTWNSSMTGGNHQIVAALCPGEAFVSWKSTAGTLNSTVRSNALLDVESNGTLTATYGLGYNVTFNESGLIVGTQWTVNLAGNIQSQSISLIVFGVANGTYAYTISPQQDYAAKYSGSVTVDGAEVNVTVRFTSLLYVSTFQESGLPADTQWSVTFNDTREFALSPSINFAEINGTYNYTVWSVSGFRLNVSGGEVVVAGDTHTILLKFTAASNSTAGLPVWQVYALVGGVAGVVLVAGAVVVRRSHR